MRKLLLSGVCVFAVLPILASAQPVPAAGPYSVIKTARVGGDGAFDYTSSKSPLCASFYARNVFALL